MKKLAFFLALLLTLSCISPMIAEEVVEKLTPKYDEMVIPVGESLLTRYSSSTNAMKAAGVTYETDNTAVATVNDKGYVKGIAPGECMLTITSKHNTSVSASIPVRVISPLKRIELSVPAKTMAAGSTMQIAYELVPEHATTRDVTFASNKENVATVSADGLVTAHKRGEVRITASNEDSDVKTTLTLTVVQLPKTIEFGEEEYNVPVGKSKKLKATVKPNDANNKKITWASSDPSIAKVDANGTVKAVKPGDVTITATSQADPSVVGSVTLHSVLPAKSLHFNRTEYAIPMGETYQLEPVVLPEEATNKRVKYEVRNPNICSVDENGLITTLHGGRTAVVATTADGSGHTVTLQVRTVVPVEEVYFRLPGFRVAAGTHAFIQPMVKPAGATSESMYWSSDDPSVATVTTHNNRVRIEGKRWGKCTITGATSNGVSVTLDVHVGALWDALTVEKVRLQDGQLIATVHNASNLPMTSATLLVKDKNGEQVLPLTLNLAAGTMEEIVLPVAVSGKTVEATVAKWETSEGFDTNAGEHKSVYRLSRGHMNWGTNQK